MIQKYKEFYYYKELCNILKNNQELIKMMKDENNLINYLLLTDEIIIEIMKQLPREYFEFNQEKEILKKYMKNILSDDDIEINNNSFKYISDFEIS